MKLLTILQGILLEEFDEKRDGALMSDKFARQYIPLLQDAGISVNIDNLTNLSGYNPKKVAGWFKKFQRDLEKKQFDFKFVTPGSSDADKRDLSKLMFHLVSQARKKIYPKKQDIVRDLQWDEQYLVDLVTRNKEKLNSLFSLLTGRDNSDIATHVLRDNRDAKIRNSRQLWMGNKDEKWRKARIKEVVRKMTSNFTDRFNDITPTQLVQFNNYELLGDEGDPERWVYKYFEDTPENRDMMDVRKFLRKEMQQ